jgi:hypothetical protein
MAEVEGGGTSMEVGVRRRIRVLFGAGAEAGVELVMVANGLASVALAAMGWLVLDLPLAWMMALVPVLFLAFAACLLVRRAAASRRDLAQGASELSGAALSRVDRRR